MLYQKSLLYKRNSEKSFSIEKKQTRETVEQVKETAIKFLHSAKLKVNELLSEENKEKIKHKTQEFTEDAKEAFDTISEKGTELATETAEHLVDFAEDAKADLKEASAKVKNFFNSIRKK